LIILQLLLVKLELLLGRFGFTQVAQRRRVFESNFWLRSAEFQRLGELLACFGELFEFQQRDSEVVSRVVVIWIQRDRRLQMGAAGSVLTGLIFQNSA